MSDPGNLDVTIEIAADQFPVQKPIGRAAFQHSTQSSLIRINDVADFEIKAGRQIRIWPATGATQKEVEIFLCGPVWATLCYQRGILPLHASAIVTKRGITGFAGRSGTGKSTIAALLNSRGYELITDDILPISFDHNCKPGAWPYLRRLKLHLDPIIRFAFAPGEAVSERLDKDKYFVAPKRSGEIKWRKLERLYLLENDATDSCVRIERLTGADAVLALIGQSYHFNVILGTRRFGEHLAFCTRLASEILIYSLRRPQMTDAKSLSSLICTHFKRQTESL